MLLYKNHTPFMQHIYIYIYIYQDDSMWMHAAWCFIDDTLRTLLQCMCFFLFHLSLLLSVLRPPISRFVKPICLFPSKVVGFRDKNKHSFKTNLRIWTFPSTYRGWLSGHLKVITCQKIWAKQKFNLLHFLQSREMMPKTKTIPYVCTENKADWERLKHY